MMLIAKPESIKSAISELERQISDYHRAQLGSYYGMSDEQVARSKDFSILRDINGGFGRGKAGADIDWLNNAESRLRTLKRLLEGKK